MRASPTDDVCCLVLSQVVGMRALQARVPVALKRALDAVRETSERLVQESGGRLVQSSAEGWLAVWPSTPRAIQYALRLQEELLHVEWPPTLILRPEAAEGRDAAGRLVFRGPRVRQGVHVGRLELRTDRDGREVGGGPAVYQVARVTHAAHGGQVVLSEQAWRHMRGSLGGTTVLRDLGAHRFEGVLGSGRLYQVLPAGLDGRSFPPPRTRNATLTNIAERDRVFVGRSGDLAALAELDDFGVRMVTVVGPPGVGKSRLVRQYGLVHADRYREEGGAGAWIARLDEPTASELVRVVGHALDVPLVLGRQHDELVLQLGHALAARGRMLLIVDGVDDGADALTDVLDQWMRLAPAVRFLVAATSRLGLKGEVSYELGPFPPGDAGAPRSADAARLFVARGQEVAAGAPQPDPEALRSLGDRLGRVPLAVELAAGLVDREPPAELLGRLEVPGDPVDAVLDAVWAHLGPGERAVMESCATYPGGFDRLAAAAIVDAPVEGRSGEAEPAGWLRSLVARGLIRAAVEPGAPVMERYVVPPVVRRYVLERMPPERRDALRRRFADQLLALCEAWPEAAWGRDGPEVVARIGLEWTNLVEMTRWALEEGRDAADVDRGLRALPILQPLFATRGPNTVFLELLDLALERSDVVLGADPVRQVWVLAARADTSRRAGRTRQARADLERGLAIAERWADAEGQGLCWSGLGLVLRDLGREDDATEALERARALFSEAGSSGTESDDHRSSAASSFGAEVPRQARSQGLRRREGIALGAQGVLWLERGRLADADACLQAAIALFREIGARHYEAKYLGNLGLLYRRMGRPDQTRALYREAIRIHRETGDARLEGVTLLNLGALDYHLARLGEARRAYGEALLLARSVGDRQTEAACMANTGLVEVEEGKCDEARQALLQALAIHRDLDDRRGEGLITGYLGVVQHVEGRIDGARESYRKAIAALEAAGPRRFEVLFTAWLAAAEAEDGHVDTARQILDVLVGELEHLADRDLRRTVDVLARLVPGSGAPDGMAADIEALRKGAEGDARLALRLADRVLNQG